MGLVDKIQLKKRRSREILRNAYFFGVFLYSLPRFDIRKYAWKWFSIFVLSYMIFFTAINMRIKTRFMVKIAIAKTSISSFMCLLILLITYLKRKDLIAFLDYVERGFYTYSDEAPSATTGITVFRYRFSVDQSNERSYVRRWFRVMVLLYCSAVLIQPILLLLKGDFFKKTSRSLTLTKLPWKRDTFFKFYLGHATLILFTTPVAATLAGGIAFILNVYFEFRDQFERLTYALRTLQQRSLPPPFVDMQKRASVRDVTKFDANQNAWFDRNVIECMLHYNTLTRAFKTLQPWFSFVFATVLVHSVLTLAMIAYGALMNIGNIEITVFYIYTLFLYTLQFFAHCYIGEKISSLNENMIYEIYNIPWYRASATTRRLVYVFMCQVQRPMSLKALKIYPASFAIFSSIMKLSYSYLNLLRTYGSSSRKG